MPRRPPLRPLLLGLLLLALPACSSDPEPAPRATGPVDVPAASVDDATRAACARLVAGLPDEVDPGVERRPVSGDAELTAAWGDPVVTLECGVPLPDRPEEPVSVNGLVWSVRDIGAGFRWTTTDRVVNVAVEVPDAYPNGAELINPLVAPVTAVLPAVTPTATPSP